MPIPLTQDMKLRFSPDEGSGGHDWRLGRFPNLMPRRIQEVLLVSSPYDSFILEEDGLLTEMVFTEYQDLGLTHSPNITRVSTGEEALATIRQQHFDLVITLLRLGDMDVANFGQAVRELNPDLPVVLLVANEWELARISRQQRKELNVDSSYVWHGDTKVFLAIIKVLEDRLNAEHDTRVGDVGVIILIEDSVRFRSSLLPIIYSELVKQTRAVMADGLNHMDKLLRMRARPKVLVAETYEQGMELYKRFHKQLFGVISDVAFSRGGRQDLKAGITFISHVKLDLPDVPTLLQSSDARNGRLAEQIGARFLHKRSATLLEDVRNFMLDNFGFGEFVFRMPDMCAVGRAADLHSMREALRKVPLESIEYHARRNHFSNWLRARTEFALARQLRPRRVSEFNDLEELRRYLIRVLSDAIRQNRRGVVEDFSRQRFDAGFGVARIRSGSLGGKARGLAFVDALLAGADLDREFPGIHVHVPRSVVIGTDVFDEFLDTNRIRLSALCAHDDEWINRTFLAAKLPEDVVDNLRAFLDIVREPLAVRSSSLLEDSQYHPFAGVYETHMLANNHPDEKVRLAQAREAVKLVYASSFYSAARRYLDATPHRIEEEKMAVILQPIVGARHGEAYYPNFSGVARSYNYYPFEPMQPEDGVAIVALGLGKTVVDGGQALRFCPKLPQVLPQMGAGEEFINQSQRTFYAIDLSDRQRVFEIEHDRCVVQLELELAERHGTLALLGSVWSLDNEALYDGIQRPGVRVVSFAHLLKSEVFPLAPLLRRLLEIGRAGLNSPVEIEFAANLEADPKEFAVLQIRPCCRGADLDSVELDDLSREELLCYSPHALGNGILAGLTDVIYVKPDRFDPARTPAMAEEIGKLNEHLLSANRPCVLIGPGRWGSSHSYLGIPVTWAQICAARVIVETTLQDFVVEPSQGSHFFQNLTSFGIAYLTVNPFSEEGFIDWTWLDAQPAARETAHVRHVRLPHPLEARLNGQKSHAAVLKRATRSKPDV
ncbi:MAG: histidine kinase [Phycisphaerae bacterium]|nr:histidine kinase [Phycisphaerae bacterium]